MSDKWTHIPVLAQEITELLLSDKNGVYIDGTAGLGGHIKYFLSALAPGGKVIGFDVDKNALEMAVKNTADGRFIPVNASYTRIPEELSARGFEKVNGVLFDLGLSSYQLDDASRGFSFNKEAPLDMRFGRGGLSAADVVNTYRVEDLKRIFEDYGEEYAADKASAAIVLARREKKIETTTELAGIISGVIKGRGKTHPATRIFQALRIEVNKEFENVLAIKNILEKTLLPGGRAAVITFHSLEDRIVKRMFKEMDAGGAFKLVNKKVIEPARAEVLANRRSRSAKLRVIEKI